MSTALIKHADVDADEEASPSLILSPLSVSLDPVIQEVIRACIAPLSPHTQRAYSFHLSSFLGSLLPGESIRRETIARWLTARKHAGKGAVTLNVGLAACKLLSRELWLRGLIPSEAYNAIADLRTRKRTTRKLGHWTDETGVEILLGACSDAREKALIGIMCGCGLRRSEIAGLRWSQYQEFHGRKVLVDIHGKGGRVRSVAVPNWAAELMDEYRDYEQNSEQESTEND